MARAANQSEIARTAALIAFLTSLVVAVPSPRLHHSSFCLYWPLTVGYLFTLT